MAGNLPRPARVAGLALGLAGVVAGAVFIVSTTTSPVAAGSTSQPVSSALDTDHHHAAPVSSISSGSRAAAQLATAAYQDVEVAAAAGWTSSLQTLGCFQDPERGGMGVHYVNDSLLDATVDPTRPEALVYELDAHGAVTGLVAHEYIVPVDAWSRKDERRPAPPRLFGVAFHRHPSLPLYVLHAWLWKDNPRGVFADWNPSVRQCPAGVPVFGG